MSMLAGLPELVVEAGGGPLSAEDARALGGIRVQQRLSLPSLCELTFVDPGGPVGELAGLTPGTPLRVALTAGPLLFGGEVTAVEHGYGPTRTHEVKVRGYDVLHRLRKRQPVRAHVELTLLELARDLVADLGVTVEAVDSGPLWRKLVQYRQSDLQLLAEVAERRGLYFVLRDRVLHFITLAGVGPPVALALGQSLLEARIDVNADPACRAVRAEGWDPWYSAPHQHQAKQSAAGRHIPFEVRASDVGGDDERHLVDEIVQDEAQLAGLAQATLDLRRAAEVSWHGVAEGDPRLRPGAPVTLSGVAAGLAGRYVLTRVDHVIDREQGFLSEIDTRPPPPTARPRAATATLGIVTQVDDPEGLGRIKVRLASYAEIETDWLEVVVPGAGQDKGLIALPDGGDRVLVLLVGGDPAQGVVLGGLYGRQAPPDAGVTQGAVRRYTLRTPGGQRVRLDDDGNAVRMDNRNGEYVEVRANQVRFGDRKGNVVEMLPELLRIHAEADLLIEAPGRSVLIRGQAIDFERG